MKLANNLLVVSNSQIILMKSLKKLQWKLIIRRTINMGELKIMSMMISI